MDILGRLQHHLARRAVRRRFAAVRCSGLEHLRDLPVDRPAILAPIHTSWWDGFFASCLYPHLPGRVFRLAQQQMHLDRYPWFKRAGVIGLDATSPGKLRASMDALASALAEPRVLLVFFPQGRLTIQDAAPIQPRRGMGSLAAKSAAPVVPMVWRHGLRDGSQPELWMRAGPPLSGSGDTLVEAWRARMEELEQTLRDDWNHGRSADYHPLFAPRLPINEKWVALRNRLSGRGRPPTKTDGI